MKMNVLKPSEGRLWKIDFLRGIAVIMMIVFHFLYDLNYFEGYSFALSSGFWWMFARATLTIFLFLAGVSLALSYSRARTCMTGRDITKKYLMRGLKIFCWGIIITVLTYFLLDSGTIWFGVLQLIGVSIILVRPLLARRMTNLLLGIAFILAGLYLGTMIFGFPWLLPLGFRPAFFYSLDYVPVFPWFGVVLLGLFTGKTIYPKKAKPSEPPKAAGPLSFIGRHSLLIYLLHQPVLIGLLYLL